MPSDIRQYETYEGYLITKNLKERTYSIYSQNKEFLSTVNFGELNDEIRELRASEDRN